MVRDKSGKESRYLKGKKGYFLIDPSKDHGEFQGKKNHQEC